MTAASVPYKALVLDVDGTLLHAGRKIVSPECAAALWRLREKDVAVVVASGRAPHACAPAIFSGFVPNHLVCVNGAYIQGEQGQSVYEDRLPAELVMALTGYAQENGYAVTFSFEDAYYAYNRYEEYLQYYGEHWGAAGHVKDGMAHTRHLQSLPFGAFAVMPQRAAEAFGALCPRLRLVKSAPDAYDVCKAYANKARGLDILLGQIGLGWHQVVAVGDGDNDVEMLKSAGLGVAMANASPAAMAAANRVAGSVYEDGVVALVEELFGR